MSIQYYSISNIQTLKQALRIKKVFFGFSVLVFFVVLSSVADILVPYPSQIPGSFKENLPMSIYHPLGTDIWGRDVMHMLIQGIKNSFQIGFIGGITGATIGLSLGLLSGYMGGKTDHLIRTLTDTFMVIPTWPILVLIGAYVRMDIVTIALLIAMFSWSGTTRNIRSQVMSLREMSFINIAKVSGEGSVEIAFKEIMPNIFSYVFMGLLGSITSAMNAEVGLELIGLGVRGESTLGLILSDSMRSYAFFKGSYNLFIPPILVLGLLWVSLQIANIGLDDFFNPKLKTVTGR